MKGGIILLDKAEGISSAAALARVKKKLSLHKVGHAGTLDPMATGLLVCLSNGATRLASFAEKGRKVYSGLIRLGVTTDTDDREGQIVAESHDIPDYTVVEEAIASFRGEIQQVPPQISAIKIAGERSYRRVRRGETPVLQARTVQVYSLEIQSVSLNEISFRLECGSGTYVRSIARDLGLKLGCGASLWSLRREFSYPFNVRSVKVLEDLSQSDILDWVALFPDVAQVSLDSGDARRLKTGDIKSVRSRLQQIISPQVKGDPETVIYIDRLNHEPLGLLKNIRGVWEIGLNLS